MSHCVLGPAVDAASATALKFETAQQLTRLLPLHECFVLSSAIRGHDHARIYNALSALGPHGAAHSIMHLTTPIHPPGLLSEAEHQTWGVLTCTLQRDQEPTWWWLPLLLEMISTPDRARSMLEAAGVKSSSHVSTPNIASSKHSTASPNGTVFCCPDAACLTSSGS